MFSPVSVLNRDANYMSRLPSMFNEDGYLNLFSFHEYKEMDQEALRLFCHFHGRYLLPTWELITGLKSAINTSKAIEIGAGCGDLGYHLGIPMTDNYCQTWPEVRAYYTAMKQPIIKYGPDVEEIDALEAVKKYKPDVVIGAWVTHWIDPDGPPVPGSVYGIKEDEILKHVDMYIVIGSKEVHKIKPILKLPHLEVDGNETVKSRSSRNDDIIYLWSGTGLGE